MVGEGSDVVADHSDVAGEPPRVPVAHAYGAREDARVCQGNVGMLADQSGRVGTSAVEVQDHAREAARGSDVVADRMAVVSHIEVGNRPWTHLRPTTGPTPEEEAEMGSPSCKPVTFPILRESREGVGAARPRGCSTRLRPRAEDAPALPTPAR